MSRERAKPYSLSVVAFFGLIFIMVMMVVVMIVAVALFDLLGRAVGCMRVFFLPFSTAASVAGAVAHDSSPKIIITLYAIYKSYNEAGDYSRRTPPNSAAMVGAGSTGCRPARRKKPDKTAYPCSVRIDSG